MNHSISVAGIDTGKHRLDVALTSSRASLEFGNDAAGHRKLSHWLRRQGVERIGIEASGGYERAVVRQLRQAGFEVLVLQPIQVRSLARMRLQRAKNDRIDAALIATCAALADSPRQAPDPRLEDLGERLTLVEQIEEDIVRMKTRLEAYRSPPLRETLRGEIKRLKALRAAELKYLARLVYQHDDLAHRLALIESVPGLGQRTALALLIRLPEIGCLSREQAAALVGVAPFDDDSASRRGQRRIAGGRRRLRKSLYAAALPAAFRWNPALVSFYKRLTRNGKTHKAALVACTRKLLIYANTVVARDTPWQPQNAPS